MARAATGEGESRLILAYNDLFEVHNGAPPGSGDIVFDADYSIHGLSTSDDEGVSWVRRGQLQPSMSGSIEAMRGDPWVAAADELVLYTGMTAPRGDGSGLTGPSGVMLAISTNGAGSWDYMEEIYASPGTDRPDGTKVAVSRDGSLAVVSWMEIQGSGGTRRTFYMTIDDPGLPSRVFNGPFDLDEEAGLASPTATGFVPLCDSDPVTNEPNWMRSFPTGHPVPAIGPEGGMYIARVVQYHDPDVILCGLRDTDFRLELFRSLEQGQPDSWTRILHAGVGDSSGVPGPGRVGQMLGVGELTDPGTRPSLTITQTANGTEDALMAMEQISNDEVRQRIVLRRVPFANSCVSSGRMTDSCPNDRIVPEDQVVFQVDENEYKALESPYHYGYMPALFNGGGGSVNGDGVVDPRVGLIFYVQPYRGAPAESEDSEYVPPTNAERRYTTVVGLVSQDGGASWGIAHGLTEPVAGRPSLYTDTYAGHSGVVFLPCPVERGYFGHYISGAFQRDSVDERFAVGSWADSRQGCLNRDSWKMDYQQVFSARFPPQLSSP